MKKIRLISMLTSFLLLMQLLSAFVFAEQQISVPDDYIGIYDADDLELMRENSSGKFILMNDIVFEDPAGGGTNFETITWPYFSGELDGNGKSIRNIYTDYGIFSDMEQAYIHDITIEGYGSSGAIIAAVDRDSKIENVTIFGEVCCNLTYSYGGETTAVGGIIGTASETTFINCRSYVDVIVYQNEWEASCETSAYIGGITGKTDGESSFEGCINYGCLTLSANNSAVIGGIVAEAFTANVNKCINYGSIIVDQEDTIMEHTVTVGGIVGTSEEYEWWGYTQISDCYNAGFFDLNTNYTLVAGGLLGFVEEAIIHHNYNVATVYNGAIAGLLGGQGENVTIEQCLFTDDYTSAYGDSESTDGMVVDGGEFDFNVFIQDEEEWNCDFEADYPYPYLTDIGVALFQNGSGTEEDPYLISNYNELNLVRRCLSAHYKVIADIEGPEQSKPFYPIGNYFDEKFTGVFDGNGHTINVNMNWEEEYYKNYISEENNSERNIEVYMGLFSENAGTVKNLTISSEPQAKTSCVETIGLGIFPKHKVFCGVIAGFNSGTIERCDVQGVHGVIVGGVVAYNNGIIQDCTVSGILIGSVSAGGIAAVNQGYIKRCANVGSYVSKVGLWHSGQSYNSAAGIAAHNDNGTIEDCYNAAKVYYMGMDEHIPNGDAAGIAWGGTISRSYCVAQSGIVYDKLTSASFGKIKNLEVKIGSGIITDCYVLDLDGESTANNALSFEEMKNQASFNNFDFSNVWTMSDRNVYPFPVLRDQPTSTLVNYRQIIGACISKLPDRLNYTIGETVDFTGFEMNLYRTDGTKAVCKDTGRFLNPHFDMETSSLRLNDMEAFTKTGNRIGVVYDTNNEFCLVALAVNVVSEKKATGLEVVAPDKLVYCKDEKLDTTGMIVTASYNTDQSEELTEGYTLTGYDPKVVGTQTVTVSYGDNTDTFDVTVKEHTISELIIDQAPTCVAGGTGYKECTICHKKLESNIKIDIDADAHKWESEYTIDLPATCGKVGSKSIYCELCNEQKADSVTTIPATGEHSAGELVVDDAPTCNSKGVGHKKCTVCYKVVQSNIGIAMDPDAHKWRGEYTIDTPATCGKEGSKSIYCELCGAQNADSVTAIPSTGEHSAGELKIDIAPTCSFMGTGHRECTVCGEVAQSNISIAIDPDAHKWESKYTVDIPATCGKAGSKSIYCEFCDVQKKNSATVIPATGAHIASKKISTVIPETCGKDGVGKKLCTVCGKDAKTDIVIPATGKHSAGELVVDTAATCTAKGVGHRNCTVCGKLTESNIEIAKTSHKADDWKVVKEATTSKSGLKEQRCTICNTLLDSKVIAKKTPVISFTDVKKSDYYYDAVVWAVGEGVTMGTSKTTFGPKDSCTRAQAVTFLWRAAGSPAPKSNNNPFTDLKKNAYYYNAVLWAVENGITTGVSKTTFAPEEVCTRGQIVTFLWRAQSGEKVSASNPFADVEKNSYYYNAVLWAVKNNVTKGTSATTFSSKDTCTRGQIVTFLYRAIAK